MMGGRNYLCAAQITQEALLLLISHYNRVPVLLGLTQQNNIKTENVKLRGISDINEFV